MTTLNTSRGARVHDDNGVVVGGQLEQLLMTLEELIAHDVQGKVRRLGGNVCEVHDVLSFSFELVLGCRWVKQLLESV